MKEDMFNELIASIKEGGEIIKGKKKPSRIFSFETPNVQSIRQQYGLSQEKFAQLLSISVATLRNWEQGRRKPHGPARVLLMVAAKHPKAILDSIHND